MTLTTFIGIFGFMYVAFELGVLYQKAGEEKK